MDRFESINMMTSSSSQYLPPDYLQPLPTTLDAKNSPLALLAQTCSSIGKDPPSKQIIPNIEKKENSDKTSANDSNNSNKLSSNKQKDGRISVDRSRPSSSESKEIHNFYPISTSSPKLDRTQKNEQKVKEENRKGNDKDTKSTSVISRPLSSSSSNGIKSSSDRASPPSKTLEQSTDKRDVKYSPPLKRQRSESPVSRRDFSPSRDSKHAHSMYPGLPYGALNYSPYGPGGLSASAESLAAAGYPFYLGGQGGYSGYSLASAHASALAAHQAALKSGSSAALSQYMQYARMKAPQGVTVCKDPYCSNCVSSSMQASHLPSQCTSPGCAQCSHEKSLQGLNPQGLHGSNPFHSSPFTTPSGLPSASVGLSALHSLYAQNLITQQQGHPHVCSWMAGNEYCGKRFTTSEELLQHLRTHTSGGGESALSAYYSLGLAIPPPGDISGIPGYLPSAGNLSPETLRRMYPTSLSPLGSSALSNRYHPYKSGLPNVPSGLPAHQSLSSLAPYYSAYGVYGQRIGAAAVP